MALNNDEGKGGEMMVSWYLVVGGAAEFIFCPAVECWQMRPFLCTFASVGSPTRLDSHSPTLAAAPAPGAHHFASIGRSKQLGIANPNIFHVLIVCTNHS